MLCHLVSSDTCKLWVMRPGLYKIVIKGIGPENAYVEYMVIAPLPMVDEPLEQLTVYANTATTFVNVKITLDSSANIEYSILDLSGNIV